MTKQNGYEPIELTPQPHFGNVHTFYAAMGGFAFYGPYDDGTPKSLFGISTNPRCTVEVPTLHTFMYIMKHFPHIITDITEDDILDRAASSSLSKALLIVQVAWFCMNCTSRLFQGLPLSLLEVSTAAHAICTLITYFVWWSKPINVATPTLLREKEAREVYALLKCSRDEYDEALEMARKRAAGDSWMPTGPLISEKIVLAADALQHLLPNPERPSSSFDNRNSMLPPGDGCFGKHVNNPSLATTAISPLFYGLIHFLAWSDQFPTPLEQLLWRVSSFVVTCSGFVVVFVMLSADWLGGRYDPYRGPINVIALFVCVGTPLAHILASGFLLVESVRQLFFLNGAAYQLPSWSNYWPHFS